MRALTYHEYGSPDVLRLEEVDPPAIGDRDVLVRVRASSINGGDWLLLTAPWLAIRLFAGLRRPRRPVLGVDVAGVVEAVGARVSRFAVGDAVLGMTPSGGAFAELARVPEKGLVAKPEGLGFDEAAAAPVAGITALQGLRDVGGLRAGHRVLVIGAGGGVGSFAVSIARALGAEAVDGVCSARKAELVRSLGAARAIDYGVEDPYATDARYDVVLDTVGAASVRACKRLLAPGGTYVAVSGTPLRSLRVALLGGRRARAFIAGGKRLPDLVELLASGAVAPAIDRRVPLEGVPEAMRAFGAGEVAGKAVVVVG